VHIQSRVLRTVCFALVVLASVAGQPAFNRQPAVRVAVMAREPGGRGQRLARAVAERLRARGVDARAVAAPLAFSPNEEDAAARRAGATRVLALDLLVWESRQSHPAAPGPPQGAKRPELRVWNLAVSTVVQANEPHNELGPPGPTGAASEAQSLDQAPTLPPTSNGHPEAVVEELRGHAQLQLRRVDAERADVYANLGAGAMTTWRTDLDGGRRLEHRDQVWEALMGELADQAVERTGPGLR
jgi:hypothetical protein